MLKPDTKKERGGEMANKKIEELQSQIKKIENKIRKLDNELNDLIEFGTSTLLTKEEKKAFERIKNKISRELEKSSTDQIQAVSVLNNFLADKKISSKLKKWKKARKKKSSKKRGIVNRKNLIKRSKKLRRLQDRKKFKNPNTGDTDDEPIANLGARPPF